MKRTLCALRVSVRTHCPDTQHMNIAVACTEYYIEISVLSTHTASGLVPARVLGIHMGILSIVYKGLDTVYSL